jgi:uncharacterized protein (TIGR00251 family)
VVLNVRVVPRSSREKVVKEEGRHKVYLTQPAQDGRANAQLIALLSAYLKIKKYQLKIIKGEKSRDKLVQVDA